MQRGINKFKQKVEKAVTSELEQSHRRDTLRPVRTDDFSEEQKYESLAMLAFLKEKRYVSIKGRAIANGRKQQENIKPKDATSLTVSTEAVMITMTIDSLKGIYVDLVDIPGAYLSANMDVKAHVVFRGTLADLMVAADT